MRKLIDKQKSALIYYKDDNALINEGLMNPYYYNFGTKSKDYFEECRTNCRHM